MIPATTAFPHACRAVRRRLTPAIRAAVASVPTADRYRKHFPAAAHLWLLVLHGLDAAPSLRQFFTLALTDPRLFLRLGLERGLSFSQFARSTTSRPTACLEQPGTAPHRPHRAGPPHRPRRPGLAPAAQGRPAR